MPENDLELLAEYARHKSENAFATLVDRHLDLVYSAALRQVRSPELAEEVSQSVFTDLARNATRLKPDTILTAWLYQVARRTAIDVVRRESRRQERERLAAEIAVMNAADWPHIEPLLDEAMDALDETDRAAILLRYFEEKSLREVGAAFGTNDDAAQKRVSRAVERLREFFAKRGVGVGASGLVLLISANAVQSAPAGLTATISSGAVFAATAVNTSMTITTAKIIAMTTLQKSLIAVAIAAVIGASIYTVPKLRAPKTITVSSTNTAVMNWGSTMICGGWKTPSGKSAYLFATPTLISAAGQIVNPANRPPGSNLNIKLDLAEMDNPMSGIPAPGSFTGILQPDQYALLMKQSARKPHTSYQSMIVVGSGQQAIIGIDMGVKGSTEIAVKGTISDNDQQVELEVAPKITFGPGSKKL